MPEEVEVGARVGDGCGEDGDVAGNRRLAGVFELLPGAVGDAGGRDAGKTLADDDLLGELPAGDGETEDVFAGGSCAEAPVHLVEGGDAEGIGFDGDAGGGGDGYLIQVHAGAETELDDRFIADMKGAAAVAEVGLDQEEGDGDEHEGEGDEGIAEIAEVVEEEPGLRPHDDAHFVAVEEHLEQMGDDPILGGPYAALVGGIAEDEKEDGAGEEGDEDEAEPGVAGEGRQGEVESTCYDGVHRCHFSVEIAEALESLLDLFLGVGFVEDGGCLLEGMPDELVHGGVAGGVGAVLEPFVEVFVELYLRSEHAQILTR